ncbi:MAG: helix-turn-helix domain-containing protein [Acidithiobacillus sp.]
MDTRQLVEKAQQNGGFKSLRDMAKAMGLNNSSLSLLASGKGELSDETYIKLAELAGIDPAEVILEKHMRKAGPKGRAVWERISKTLPRTAALLAGVAIITVLDQHITYAIPSSALTNTYYVKPLLG